MPLALPRGDFCTLSFVTQVDYGAYAEGLEVATPKPAIIRNAVPNSPSQVSLTVNFQ